jgi:hypothetical protein
MISKQERAHGEEFRIGIAHKSADEARFADVSGIMAANLKLGHLAGIHFS